MRTKMICAALLVAALCMTACDSLKTAAASASNTEAYTAGSSAGKALRNLYTQYKADGKFEMTNLSNITNLLLLSNSWQEMKSAQKGTDFYQDFTKGIIAGSNNLVTNTNSNSVLDAITSTVNAIDNSNLGKQGNNSAAGNTTNAGEIVSTASTLLSLFGK